jgi:hypothetical protein
LCVVALVVVDVALVVSDLTLVIVVSLALVVSDLTLVIVVSLALVVSDLTLVIVVSLVVVAGIDRASVSAARVPTQLLAALTHLLAVLRVPLAAVIPAVGMRAVVSVSARRGRARQSQKGRDCKRQKTNQSCSLHAFSLSDR